ncbi:hypothetical protein Rsub_04215 [Raphidocelis subcapitata]|uniref:Uncharacterized protein n=1 Tax=Raphidocelis subcapitata TaxID=307507 RepID=A0A2V0P332_9CHLO|nr:hypothetical protein Rsub_04215 [Raphidocelis subcapitata]|eukprot:GBF91475.1 hypothetical protein Rsub_04215 [Raphidocelis subcapitata]
MGAAPPAVQGAQCSLDSLDEVLEQLQGLEWPGAGALDALLGAQRGVEASHSALGPQKGEFLASPAGAELLLRLQSLRQRADAHAAAQVLLAQEQPGCLPLLPAAWARPAALLRIGSSKAAGIGRGIGGGSKARKARGKKGGGAAAAASDSSAALAAEVEAAAAAAARYQAAVRDHVIATAAPRPTAAQRRLLSLQEAEWAAADRAMVHLAMARGRFGAAFPEAAFAAAADGDAAAADALRVNLAFAEELAAFWDRFEAAHASGVLSDGWWGTPIGRLWLARGREYRLLVEPLDCLAHYWTGQSGDYADDSTDGAGHPNGARPRRYPLLQSLEERLLPGPVEGSLCKAALLRVCGGDVWALPGMPARPSPRGSHEREPEAPTTPPRPAPRPAADAAPAPPPPAAQQLEPDVRPAPWPMPPRVSTLVPRREGRRPKAWRRDDAPPDTEGDRDQGEPADEPAQRGPARAAPERRRGRGRGRAAARTAAVAAVALAVVKLVAARR